MEWDQLHSKALPLLSHVGLHPNNVTALSHTSMSLPKAKCPPKLSGPEICLLGGNQMVAVALGYSEHQMGSLCLPWLIAALVISEGMQIHVCPTHHLSPPWQGHL